MNEIFIQYVTEYTNTRRRAFALFNATQMISIYAETIGTENIKTMLSGFNQFAETYHKAWPWNRGKVVAEQIRNFTIRK